VLSAHGSALVFAISGLATQSFGGKAALSSDTLLALIYTYPMLAVAVFHVACPIACAAGFISAAWS